MDRIVECVWEHNGDDTLLYAVHAPGAYARGRSLGEALAKLPTEMDAYQRWLGDSESYTWEPLVVQEKVSALTVSDADSDVLFEAEREPLTEAAYRTLRERTLRSAADFRALYLAVPDKNVSALPPRKTFYGAVPRTAEEMYTHTRGVNSYYFAEIGVDADSDGTILECRTRGFDALEKQAGFLTAPVVSGSYGEEWSLAKVLRRFLWHDRIHARAMYRMAVRTFGPGSVPDVFRFARRLRRGNTRP